MPSNATKKKRWSFTIGPPTVPPNCSRLEIRQRLAVRGVRRQPLEPLEVEQAPARRFVPDLVITLTTPPAVRPNSALAPGRDHLEFLDRFERDVDGGALAAHLLAEEAVVVVAAVEADVVEHAALAGEVDLVAVGPLRRC